MNNLTFYDTKCRTDSTKPWVMRLMLCMVFLIGQIAFTQTTVSLGTYSGAGSTNVLLSTSTTSNNYSRTISLYTSSEVLLAGGMPGNITSLAWDKNGVGEYTFDNAYIKVYLKHVTQEQWTSIPEWNTEILGATEVFTSSTYSLPIGTGWKEVNFTNPFVWNGTDNIAVLVEWYRPNAPTGDISWGRSTTTSANASRVGSTSLDALVFLINSNRPLVQFTINSTDIITCPVPTGLTISNITAESAELSWVSDGTLFEIEYGPVGFTLGTGTIITGITANSYTFTNLTPQTSYQYYIRRDCGNDDGYSFAIGSSFTSGCGILTSNFYEDFDSTPTGSSTNPTVPDCWSFIDTGAGWGYVNATSPHTAPRNFYMYNGATSDTGHYILISPPTDNLGNGTMRVKFWARTTSTVTSPYTTVDFGTLSDPTDQTTFTVVQSIPLTNVYTEYVVEIPAGTDDYFGFRHDLVTKARYIYIDTVTYEEIPACADVSTVSLGATNITSNSAELSWLSSGTLFDIEWGPSGFSQGTGSIIPNIVNPYTLNGLSANTSYDFYVRQNCGADQSPWSGSFTFTTNCEVATAGFYEDFDTTPTGTSTNPTVPNCWTMIDTGAGYGYVNTISPHTAPRNFYMYNGAASDTGHYILVSPLTDNLGNGTMRVRFWARTTSTVTNPYTTVDFGTLSDSTDQTTFTVVQSIPLTNVYTEYAVEIPAGTDDYFGFRHDLVTKARYIYIDTVTYEEIPACADVSTVSLGATNITSNSAELSWLSSGTLFDIEWGPSGFSQGTGLIIPSIANPYTLNGLSANTSYDFYVRQNCGADQSPWSGSFTFTTTCEAITTGFYEDFDTTPTGTSTNPTVPNCWTMIDTGAGYGYVNATSPHTAPRNFYMYNGAASDSGHYILVSPPTDNLGNGTMRVKFWARSTSTAAIPTELDFGTLSDPTDETTFTSLQTIVLTTTYTEYTIMFPVTTDDYFGFRHDLVSKARGTYIDTVTYEVIPACPEPLELEVTNITINSADLSWASTGSLFDVEWGISGFIQGTGTTVPGVTATTLSLSDLNPNTSYDFYVRLDCVNEESPWTGPYTFTTGCGVSTFGFYEGFDTTPTGSSTNPTVPGCWSFIDTGAGYGYVSATTPHTAPRNFYMYNGAASDAGHYILVSPETDNLGNGTMRVRFWARTTSTVTSPAVTISFGTLSDPTDPTTFTLVQSIPLTNVYTEYKVIIPVTTDDYFGFRHDLVTKARYVYIDSVTYEAIPSCIEPEDLSVTNISTNSADLTWTSTGVLFDIEWGVSGFIMGTGTPVYGVGNPYTVTGLNAMSSYDFYVRQDCGNGDESVWIGPFTFKTACDIATSGFYEAFDTTLVGTSTNPTVPDCWSFIDTGAGYGYVNATSPHTAPRNFYMYNGSSSDTGHYILVSPLTDNLGNGTMRVRFWARTTSTVTNPAVKLDIGTLSDHTDPTTFTLVQSVSLTNVYTEYKVILPLTTDDYFGFRHDLLTKARYIYIDSITYEELPSCLEPWDLGVTNITADSAELYWEINDGTLFDIEWGINGFALGTGTSVSGVSNPYTLSDLNPNTIYQYYVRQNCSSTDQSIWMGPITFTTLCIPVSVLNENFDGVTAGTGVLPACWSKIGTSSAYVNTTAPFSAPNNLYMYKSSNVDNYLVSPYLDNLANNTHWLRFKARTTSTSTTTLTVGYLTDATDSSTFVEIETITFTGTTYPVEDFIIFPWNLSPDAKHLAFRNNTNLRTIYLDDIRWEAAPTCMYPLSLNAANVSVTSSSLSWAGTGTMYDIEYGITGFTPGLGTTIPGVGNPYTLTSLTPGVTYEYYVRQDCGIDDGYSAWSGPFEFTAGTYTGNIPTMFNENPQVTDDACATSFSIDVPEGEYLAGLTVEYIMVSIDPSWTSQQRSVLYSPTLEMGEPAVVTAGVLSENYPGIVPYNRAVDFANGATGTIEFMLKAWRTSGGAGCSTTSSYIMDGSWILTPVFEPIPSCPNPPSDLSYTNITEDAVDLIWSADTGTFQVKWGAISFNPETAGTEISDITTNSYTLSGLDSSIPYEFYVRRDCSTNDEEDFGEWVGPFRFNSGHCIPFAELGYNFSLFNTTGAVENISYTNADNTSSGGYVNNTDMVIVQDAGESFNFTSNYVGGASGLKIWIDWNNNFVFEEDEEEFFLASGSGNKSGSISIPADAINGNYRMRVRAQQGATAVPPACGYINTGEAMDFTLQITCDEVPSPIGPINQQFTQGQTLANLDVAGDNLVWYADEDLTIVLENTTSLVDQTTYYVVSTQENCMSIALSITVEEVLSVSDFNSFGFTYYPNPVGELLYLRANTEIDKVVVYSILGQQLNLPVQLGNTQIDMTGLSAGNYILSVTIEGVNKTFKVVKK